MLAPLGYELAWEDAEKRLAEWGDFSIAEDGKPLTVHLHVAFAARDNEDVDEFHRVALAAGYRDNGGPGERHYHPGYYGALRPRPRRQQRRGRLPQQGLGFQPCRAIR